MDALHYKLDVSDLVARILMPTVFKLSSLMVLTHLKAGTSSPGCFNISFTNHSK